MKTAGEESLLHVENTKMLANKNNNDVPTPMPLVRALLGHIPRSAWGGIYSVLDPCCGQGNWLLGTREVLRAHARGHAHWELHGIELSKRHADVCRRMVPEATVERGDFLSGVVGRTPDHFDLVVMNPPFAGTNKNSRLSCRFLEKGIHALAPGGWIVAVLPDSWMSCSARNKPLVTCLLHNMTLHRIGIHDIREHFPTVSVGLTWLVARKKRPSPRSITRVSCLDSNAVVHRAACRLHHSICARIGFVPIRCTREVLAMMEDVLSERPNAKSIRVSSVLHRTTRKDWLSTKQWGPYRYRVIHTPTQTLYSSQPHPYQLQYHVFLPITSTYEPFVDRCGMTHGIAFVPCGVGNAGRRKAVALQAKLSHPDVVACVQACRWGNFNSVDIMRHLVF